MRYIDNEIKPMKILLRDTITVFICIICGIFIVEQLQPVIEKTNVNIDVPLVFTDNPAF